MPDVVRLVSTPSLVSRNMPTAMMAPPRIGNTLYLPVLVVTWRDRIDVTVTPSIIGVSISPLTTAEAPWTVCWYSGRNVIAPNIAMPVKNVSIIATEKFLLRKTRSGKMGSAALVSVTRNPMVAATERTRRTMICSEPHAAQVVDLVADLLSRHVQDGEQVDEFRAAQRQVYVEDPAPGEAVGDEPAGQRAADGGEHHHHHHVAHVAPAFARRHDVAERRHRPDHQAAGSQPLQGPEHDELRHVLRQAGKRRTDEEDHDRGDEQLLAAVHVAELAVERRGDGRRQHVGGHHPGQVGHAAQAADDPRQRRADDELVEHREQNRHQQPRQHDKHLTPVGVLARAGQARVSWPVTVASSGYVAAPVARTLRHPSAPSRPPSSRPPAGCPPPGPLTYRPASHYARAVTNRPSSKKGGPGSTKERETNMGGAGPTPR